MRKLLIITLSSLILGGCTLKELFVKSPSILEISTTPESTVYLNGEKKGNTPYSNKELKAGSYTLKLVPSSDSNLQSYETKLTQISNATTVISHSFAQSELDSSGYTLQFEQDKSGETYLSIISDPDNTTVNIDDAPYGFTPLSKIKTSPGSHSLLVSSPGYIKQSVTLNAAKGYNLIANFKLANETLTLTPSPSPSSSDIASASATPSIKPSPSPSIKPSPSPSPVVIMPKPYVLIGETGTGWLRVRKDASGSSDELGKADTGEKLKYLGESTDLGWHKIEFEGKVGWVSGKYVTLVK